MLTVRLDKYLAEAGIGTRSEVKAYIKKGYISVNGAITYKPEQKVSLENDTVFFQNDEIGLSEYEYYLLNKPAGYVSATKDNLYPTVLSLINSKRRDLFPVGRLDKDTEGLLLITTDGALSHMLLSPKRHVDKTDYALLDKAVTEKDIRSFDSGLIIGDEDLDGVAAGCVDLIHVELDAVANVADEVVGIVEDGDADVVLFRAGCEGHGEHQDEGRCEQGKLLHTLTSLVDGERETGRPIVLRRA